jgi:hypothetical protein
MGLSKLINQEYKCIIQSVWIIAAWQRISPEVSSLKCFKKCCISNGMCGTDDILWSGGEEDGNFKSQCKGES